MQKTWAGLLLIGSILAAFGGVAAFIFLFVRDINVYILILSPVILACYQIPAAILYGLYKRARQSEQEPEDTDGSSSKKQVLFVCTHNSVRSQMAEGLMNALLGDRYEAFSAGTEPSIVNPRAVSVLLELEIDISHHRSKHVNEFLSQEFDYVITVCDHARESCPVFPGGKEIIHHSFVDPSSIQGKEQEMQVAFRRIRDEIRDWIAKEFG
jgi:arsenate reductase